MNPIARSLLYAFSNVFHPRMLWLMIWPMFIAFAVWGTLLWIMGAQLVVLLSGWLQELIQSGTFLIRWDLRDAIVVVAKILIFLLFIPLVWLTALLILGTFGMPAMVEHVASRRYPQLVRRQGGSIAGSVWNGAVAVAGLIGLGLVSVPFWLVPPLWPLIPVAIMGWLNQRVLRYDALAEHASGDEMQRIFASRRGTLYAMGVIVALLAYIPLIGFVAPVLFGLAFIHLLLGDLEARRQAPVERQGIDADAARRL